MPASCGDASIRLMRVNGGRSAGVTLVQVFPAVARHVHEAIVGTGPDDVAVDGRRREGEDGRVGLDAGLVERDRSARRSERRRIVARQVGADALPALAFVGGLPDVLRRRVQRLRIGRRDDDRKRPLESLGDVRGREAHRIVRPDVDRAALAGPAVDARQQAAVAAGVEDVDVPRVGRDVAALAAADRVQLAGAAARHAGGRVVLLRAAHVIRHVRGREDVVELRRRIVLIGPALAAVGRHVRAAVVAVDHPRADRTTAIHRSWLSPCGTRIAVSVLPASVER